MVIMAGRLCRLGFTKVSHPAGQRRQPNLGGKKVVRRRLQAENGMPAAISH
jgi:hypothetical protein